MRALTPFLIGSSSGNLARMTNYIIGYCAVAASSCVNVYCMRKRELTTGIPVSDDDGNQIGLSRVAAKEAINKTLISRIVYVVPMFVVPAAWNCLLQKSKLMPRRTGVTRILLESLGVAAGLYVSMPINCALYPQMSKIAVKDLEPEIAELALHRRLSHLNYNKGL